MSTRTLAAFSTIRTEGAMLPSDILVRVASGDRSLGGLEESSYHLAPGEKIGEATNRAWNRLQAAWANFQSAREKLAGTDTGTSLTRERWLLPLFQLLDYGRLQAAKAEEIGGKSYTISHAWQQTPLHLVGCNVDLDRRIQTAAGGMRSSPHSLLQELLNRSDQHLWGIVSNGLRLRLLRDNISLTRQAYVEFDLEAMMAGEAYPDFVLLWLLLHQSRFEAERPEQSQLEKWSQAARTEGVRVLEGLRDGVQRAIEHLGQGFLAHPSNAVLRENLRSGALDKQDYYRQILRLVYRLLFLFVADDRDLLLVPTADPVTQKRYRDFYTTTRLRHLATTRAGSRHHDLYCCLKLVMEKLSGDGCRELALPALGSFLFSPRALPDLNACDISNLHLLGAIRSLAVTETGQSRRVVDYKNLGAEELGSVYESLLELHPELNAEAVSFELKVAAGSERKKTGSYYTPTSLISCLLDSALDPVLLEAAQKPKPEAAILKLKVVDPACGSGHFLIAAAHRIAKRLAAVRTGEEEPPPETQRKALRDVIGHCIYGVDVNPMAVELCKVSLWMEALEPGKPLSFLEHRIQPGNSLLGATPALLAQGIPDDAFSPLEGDTKEACSKWKRVNKSERAAWEKKQQWLGFDAPWNKLGAFAQGLMALDNLGDDSIATIREKERLYREAIESAGYLDGKFMADAWCASFVWKKDSLTALALTEELFRQIERNPTAFANDKRGMTGEVVRLAGQYRFFHWHLAYPDVFDAEGKGGFDCVLGNPPWERVKLQEKEWFAERSPEIANAPNSAARKRLIVALKTGDPVLHQQFLEDSRSAEGESHFIRNSGRYPLCGRGDINVYSVFAEAMRGAASPTGRAGCIVPSGIATDDTTKHFFHDLMTTGTLASLYDFENTANLFPGVGHGRARFCLLVTSGSAHAVRHAKVAFLLRLPSDLGDPGRVFTLSADEIALLNPNTGTCPVFRNASDAELTKKIYRRVPILVREGPPEQNPWCLSFGRMLDMANDSGLFHTREQLESAGARLAGNIFTSGSERWLPLREAKMIHHYDHRFGDYSLRPAGSESTILPNAPPERLADPEYMPLPRYWVLETEVRNRIADKWSHDWLLGWRDITHATNERTVVSGLIPLSGVGHKFLLMFPHQTPVLVGSLSANLASFVFDYCARQKVGGIALTYFTMRQLPVLPPASYETEAPWSQGTALRDWLLPRVLELTYTAWDMASFARDCACPGPPFRWDAERRFLLRCELDAAFFHLYLPAHADGGWYWFENETPETRAKLQASFPTPRDGAAYILDNFPIVRRKDEQKWGEFRTKRVILEVYDAMAEAQRAGVPYQTRLDPPPADARCCHPRKKVGILAFGSLIKDPGPELAAKIVMRIETQTPFTVEYGRFSGRTRGGAPTLVPHCNGTPVPAEILVLDDEVSVRDARDMLWRRERRKIGSDETYAEGTGPDSVLVHSHESPWVETVLYTDFNAAGKIADPNPEDLARHAIQSVRKADEGKDGLSYLMSAVASGIETRLTPAYTAEILKQTQTNSLSEALRKARDRSE